MGRAATQTWRHRNVARVIAKEPLFPRSPHVQKLLAAIQETVIRGLEAASGATCYVIVADDVHATEIAKRIQARVHVSNYVSLKHADRFVEHVSI